MILKSLVAALATSILWVSAADADIVTDWNVLAVNATAVGVPNSAAQSRTLAITHAAIFDAVNAIEKRYAPYAVDVSASSGASVEAAAAAAAHGVLVKLAAGQAPALDAALKDALARITNERSREDGAAVGRLVAEQMVARRAGDGSQATRKVADGTAIDRWVPTPPQHLPPAFPQWGEMTPFLVANAAQLPITPPPGLSTPEFVREFDEIKRVGGRQSVSRTADQTAAAIFWTVQTLVPWNAAARAAALAARQGVLDNARVFALLNMAAADSQIATFAVKYRMPRWRPVTAIRTAGVLKDERLVPDPTWEPLLVTPAHPDYPSAHAAGSGAAEAVLIAAFGNRVDASVTHPPFFGVTRTYSSFSQIADEVDDARVWGGIHFRTADVAGRELGRRIGELAVQTFPRPRP